MKRQEYEIHHEISTIHKYQKAFLIAIGICLLFLLFLFANEKEFITTNFPSYRIRRYKNSSYKVKKDSITFYHRLQKNLQYDNMNILEMFKTYQNNINFIDNKRKKDITLKPAPKKLYQLTWEKSTGNKIPTKRISNNMNNKKISKSKVIFPMRLIHFDLKGAPPKIEYIEKILPIIKMAGATGILIEYEDMFPYKGFLTSAAATNAYCPQDIQRIQMSAHALNLDVIPLIQTFGHLEFMLKLPQFEHLRENPKSPASICPLKKGSFNLIREMIDQVLELHPKAKWVHIGCDEVFNLAMCQKCNKYQYKKDILYLKHVIRVAQYIQRKHNMQPIIWDDMIRRTSSRILKSFKIGSFVEPMVWVYSEDVSSLFFPRMWFRYRQTFKNMWTASAFKGAFGRELVMPNIQKHLHNHISWLSVMNQSNIKSINFNGIAITGWQRYEHFGPLCELLPVGFPSLILNTLTISRGGFTDEVIQNAQKIFKCSNSLVTYSIIRNDPFLKYALDYCSFPGAAIFHMAQKYQIFNDSLSNFIYNFCNLNKSMAIILEPKNPLQIILQKNISLKILFPNANKILSEVFDETTVNEWLQQNFYPLLKDLKKLKKIIKNDQSKITYCGVAKRNTYFRKLPYKLHKDTASVNKCIS